MFFEQDKYTKNQKRQVELLLAQESLDREVKEFFEKSGIDPTTLSTSALISSELPEEARALLNEMLALQEKPSEDAASLPRPFGM